MTRFGFAVWVLLAAGSARAESLVLQEFDGENRRSVEIVEVRGAWVNRSCQASPRKCQALRALERLRAGSQKATELGSSGTAIHPFSVACSKAGGVIRILHDPALNQLEFCRFPDGTMVTRVGPTFS